MATQKPATPVAPPKAPANEKARRLIDRARDEVFGSAIAVELVLREIATYTQSDGGYTKQLDPRDKQLLRSAGRSDLIEDRSALERELTRIERESHHRERAGTPTEFAAAKETAERAAAALLKDGDRLEAEIAQLQAKLAALHEAAKTTAAKVDDMASSREALRMWAPEFVVEACSFQREQVRQRHAATILESNARLGQLEGLVELESLNGRHVLEVRQMAEVAQQHGRGDLVLSDENATLKIDAAGWKQWMASLRKELGEAKAAIDAQQAKYLADMALADKPISDFVDAVCADPNWIEHFEIGGKEAPTA